MFALCYAAIMNNTQEVSARTLTLHPVMWIQDGFAIDHSEKTCFRYEVHDERGNNVGFITADRAMSHPALRWQISQVNDIFGISDLMGDYASVKDALVALEHEKPYKIRVDIYQFDEPRRRDMRTFVDKHGIKVTWKTDQEYVELTGTDSALDGFIHEFLRGASDAYETA